MEDSTGPSGNGDAIILTVVAARDFMTRIIEALTFFNTASNQQAC